MANRKNAPGPFPVAEAPTNNLPVGGAGEAATGLGKGGADHHPTDADIKAHHDRVAVSLGHPSNSKGKPAGY